MKDPKEKAISLLKNRDKTEHEIREALAKSGFDEIQIEDTIEYLQDSKYIDDIRYTENYVDSSKEKRRGPNRMRRDLASKGIDSNIIEDILYSSVDYEWELNTANQIAENISTKHPNLGDDKLLAKVINKLNYEGFSNDVISEVADTLTDNSDY